MVPPLPVENVIRVLDDCKALISEYKQAFLSTVAKSDQEDDPPAIILQRMFDFGCQTISAMRLILTNDDAEKNAILACILCRPYYETAARVLWASRAPYGWDRLITYHAKEDLKWAEEAQRYPGTSEPAAREIEKAKKVLARKDAGGRPFDPAPPLRQLLNEIAEQNVRDGLTKTDPNDSSGYEYSNVYRWLCRPSHGHMSALGVPKGYLRHAGASAVLASWMLLQACFHVGASDLTMEINKLGHTILKMFTELKPHTSEE